MPWTTAHAHMSPLSVMYRTAGGGWAGWKEGVLNNDHTDAEADFTYI